MAEPEPRRIKLPDATPDMMLVSALTSRTGKQITEPRTVYEIQRTLSVHTPMTGRFSLRVGEIGELSSILDSHIPEDGNSLESGHYSAMVDRRETRQLTSK